MVNIINKGFACTKAMDKLKGNNRSDIQMAFPQENGTRIRFSNCIMQRSVYAYEPNVTQYQVKMCLGHFAKP